VTLTCTRRLEFDYGHRLLTHEGKCAHVHGHRGVVEVECSAPELDTVGRVIDFAEVKRLVGGWLDERWDHAFIVGEADRDMRDFLELHEQRHFVLPVVEPTAEHLAHYVGRMAETLLAPRGITVVRLRLYETPNGWAEWQP
jgi:6-pyruvoyltetrahydropterin/6-carboxytetrahydropterin synthase